MTIQLYQRSAAHAELVASGANMINRTVNYDVPESVKPLGSNAGVHLTILCNFVCAKRRLCVSSYLQLIILARVSFIFFLKRGNPLSLAVWKPRTHQRYHTFDISLECGL